MFFYRQWYDTDADLKDADWGNDIISFIRMYQQPLVNQAHAQLGMNYLLGTQDMSAIENLFQDPAKLNLNNTPMRGVHNPLYGPKGEVITPGGTKKDENKHKELGAQTFRSLPVMEKTRNMIVAEMKKMGVVLSSKCADPTATIKRNKDESLIKNRTEIEAMMSYIYESIGDKPFKLSEYEARFGERAANGNAGDFEKMGLSEGDPSDIKFFMDNFYKLAAEIAAEKPINFLMSKNQVESHLYENWTTDFLAKKAICARVHVSKLNGQITYDYVTPETTYVFGGGRRKDFNDASAKATEQRITIKELLDFVGDSFSFENDLGVLFQAVYATSNGTIDITGIVADPRSGEYTFNGRDNATSYSYNQFINMNVNFGYIEFVSPNDTDYGEEFKKSEAYKKHYEGRDSDPTGTPNGKRYQKQARYKVETYCAYYIALGAFQQKLFDFGVVPYKDIEGYNDWDANWTILTYKEIGEAIAINCIPFIDLMNEAWYKWKFEIRRAKPPGVDYNYDSILQIAEDVFVDTNISRADKLGKMIAWLDGSSNSLWTWPEINGQKVGITNSQLNIPRPNGLSPEVDRWQSIFINTWQQMLSFVGLDAPLRQGDPGGSRDSMNNQFKALEYSQNNTYYIPDGITYMTQQIATRSLLFVQDIIWFNDYSTMAYKSLVDAVGEECLAEISELGKKATHRYGIFVESLNLAAQKARIQARIDLAIANGKISNAEALLIEEIKSPKQQAVTLAYFEQRRERLAQRNAMEAQKANSEQMMALEQAKQQTEIMKGKIEIQKEQIKADAMIQSHLISVRGGITKAEMKNTADSRQIYEQADANLKAQQTSVDQSGKPTTMPSPSAIPTGYPNPVPEGMIPENMSGLEQQMAASAPMPTTGAVI
jgi:hypothetical protein